MHLAWIRCGHDKRTDPSGASPGVVASASIVRIFPRYQLRPRYLGEARVYDMLSQVKTDGFAIHSANLPEHDYKRWGEADFVVVTRAGVTLLEVKGGTVSIAGRVWRFENARGQAITSTEGPARQALSAAVALERLLTERLGRRIRCRWGVIFPLCSFKRDIAELPPDRLADSRTCSDIRSFEDWMCGIPFDQHQATDFEIEESEIEAIRETLVPEMSASTSLGLAVRSAHRESIRLTEQQFAILESLESNPRLCISGGAGTGKTELAVLSARADKAAGRNPVIATSAGTLFHALKSRMEEFDIAVVVDTVPIGADTLIVDEGQDFARPAAMDALFDRLPGGIDAGRWRWFMDPNLQFMRAAPDRACLASLRDRSTSVALRRNVRSTREIVSVIRAFLDADVGISQIDGFGIKVGFKSVGNVHEEVAAARMLVAQAMEDGIHPTEIAILGPEGGAGPVCARLLEQLPRLLRRLPPLGLVDSSAHGVACRIQDFRGLEARVVLLVDLDLLPEDARGESLLYIGMSRASASLNLFVSPRFGEMLKKLIRRQFLRG